MNIREYFPLAKAHGKAFCNRIEETHWLLENIKACKHSLLIGPRRYGKSSLVEKTIELSGYPVSILNFNICTDEKDVENLIRRGVGELIEKALGPIDKMMHLIKTSLTHFIPKLTMGAGGASFELELAPVKKASPALYVTEALTLIEKLLAKKGKRAVFVLDAFQVVGLIAEGRGVEAAIRNSAQDMTHLVIVFAGSFRGLLKSMFEDKNKPLYKLCRKLYLKRLEAEHYLHHLNEAAELTWRKKLQDAVFQKIMTLSERHPYYVNYLCDIVWSQNKQLPTVSDIEKAWSLLIEEEKSDSNVEIAQLSMVQKKVLKYIANCSNENLSSASAVGAMGVGASSITAAISVLLAKDIIEKEEQQYFIINPVVHQLLQAV